VIKPHTALRVLAALGLLALLLAGALPAIPARPLAAATDLSGDFYVFLPAVLRDLRFGIANGDFEEGPVVWEQHSPYGPTMIVSSDDVPSYVMEPHSGKWFAMLGGGAMQAETHDLEQTFYLPASTPYLAYWYEIWSQDSCGNDYGRILVDGTPLDQLDLCASRTTDHWYKRVVDLGSYADQTISLQIQLQVDSSEISVLYVDDLVLQSVSAVTQGGPVSP
jgi:hypothetical protein